MTARIVCDSSAVIAALLDSGNDGQWASAALIGAELHAPTLLPYECTNVIRRHELAGVIGRDQAIQAHVDLLDLAVNYWPYDVLAQRIWSLREKLSSYDAAYIALAEEIDATVVTLDRRMTRAPGIRCTISTR